MIQPTKKDIAKEILSKYSYMYVHFDASNRLCILPKELRGVTHQILGMGRAGSKFPVIDLRLEDYGLSGTIKPGGVVLAPIWISIPWACVFALTNATGRSNMGRVWAEDMPSSVRARSHMHGLAGGREGSGHPTGKLRLVS